MGYLVHPVDGMSNCTLGQRLFDYGADPVLVRAIEMLPRPSLTLRDARRSCEFAEERQGGVAHKPKRAFHLSISQEAIQFLFLKMRDQPLRP